MIGALQEESNLHIFNCCFSWLRNLEKNCVNLSKSLRVRLAPQDEARPRKGWISIFQFYVLLVLKFLKEGDQRRMINGLRRWDHCGSTRDESESTRRGTRDDGRLMGKETGDSNRQDGHFPAHSHSLNIFASTSGAFNWFVYTGFDSFSLLNSFRTSL